MQMHTMKVKHLLTPECIFLNIHIFNNKPINNYVLLMIITVTCAWTQTHHYTWGIVIVAITAMPTWTVGLDLLTATGLARVTATGMWYWNTNKHTILTTDVDQHRYVIEYLSDKEVKSLTIYSVGLVDFTDFNTYWEILWQSHHLRT